MNALPSPAPDTLELFLDLSVVLTGFDLTDLQATAMGPTYLQTLLHNAGSTAPGELLQAFAQLRGEFTRRDPPFLDAFAQRIMLPFAALARNIVSLWYLGRWNQLPREWRDAHGAFASDQDQIVSAEAYVAGLVWASVDSHPRGAKAPGFGTWSFKPDVPEKIPPHG